MNALNGQGQTQEQTRATNGKPARGGIVHDDADGGSEPEPSSTYARIAPDSVQEGRDDPWFKRRVRCLIELEADRWIVFLDDQLDVYWWFMSDEPEGYGDVAARVAELEAIQISKLNEKTRFAFRCLMAQAVARLFDDKRPAIALTMLDQAEEYILTRLAELSRLWYVSVALVSGACLAITALMVYWWTSVAIEEGALAVCTGGLGACIWLILRKDRFPHDPNAGFGLHLVEAIARVALGAVAGWIAVLAVRSQIIMPADTSLSALLLLCFAAGATERFVPDLVARLGDKRVAGSPVAKSKGAAKVDVSPAAGSQPEVDEIH